MTMPNEEAISAISATGISVGDFRARQALVESLQKGESPFVESPKPVVLPITMHVKGERKVVGHALVETVDPGSVILHAVIDGAENVANLLKADMGYLSIWGKDEKKT